MNTGIDYDYSMVKFLNNAKASLIIFKHSKKNKTPIPEVC